jgi:hypothetical protein
MIQIQIMMMMMMMMMMMIGKKEGGRMCVYGARITWVVDDGGDDTRSYCLPLPCCGNRRDSTMRPPELSDCDDDSSQMMYNQYDKSSDRYYA